MRSEPVTEESIAEARASAREEPGSGLSVLARSLLEFWIRRSTSIWRDGPTRASRPNARRSTSSAAWPQPNHGAGPDR